MSALSYALATAIGNQPSPTIAMRDLVAREHGLSHRAIYRTQSGRLVVTYGRTPTEAGYRASLALGDDKPAAFSCVKIAR